MSNKSQIMKLLVSARASWQTLVVLLAPLLLCPLVFPFSETTQESKCAAVVGLMALYWITESLPMPMTSLLPLVLCPLFGIAPSNQICKAFFGESTFLLAGGIVVAIAIEECDLHKRLALKVLLVIGVEPRRLMLGILLTTAFLSMWISNTATTAMMMPITRSLLAKLFIAKRVTMRRLAASSQSNRPGDGQSLAEDKLTTSSGKLESVIIEELVPLNVPVNGDPHVRGEWTGRDGALSAKQYISPDQQGHQDANSRPRDKEEQLEDEVDHQVETDEDHGEGDDASVLKNLDPHSLALLKAFCLCVCYAANVGGMATLTGSTPNMAFSRMTSDMSKSTPVTFANWMAFSLPISVLTLIGCFVWMNVYVFGFWSTLTCRPISTEEEVRFVSRTVRQEYDKLGKIRFNEVVVLVHFLVLVVLWLARDPGSVTGWSVFFKERYVSDGSTALALAISLFIFPNERPNVLFFRRKGDSSRPSSRSSILNWKDTSRKFPWGVMFLLGGGFSLSEASKVSGLSREIAHQLTFIHSLPVWAAGMVIIMLTSLVTEITSNMVVVLLLLPILRDISEVLKVHPFYLMLPTTLASSLAFMLPIATPPNAIVFAYGDLKVIDMMKYGAVLNLIGVSSIFLAINTWGYPIYNLDTIPDWAFASGTSNLTGTSPTISNFTSPYSSNFTSPYSSNFTSPYSSNFTSPYSSNFTSPYSSNFTGVL